MNWTSCKTKNRWKLNFTLLKNNVCADLVGFRWLGHICLCVCLWMCVYACVCVFVNVCILVCVFVNVCMCKCVCILVCVCMCVWICAYVCVCTCVCMSYVCACVCMYTCVCCAWTCVLWSLNISREKIFADFEVSWLTTKILSLKILVTCGTYIWFVFCPDVLLQYYKFIGSLFFAWKFYHEY